MLRPAAMFIRREPSQFASVPVLMQLAGRILVSRAPWNARCLRWRLNVARGRRGYTFRSAM